MECSDICGLLTKREVKMAGYWPVFLLNKLAKKERGQYPAILTEQCWSYRFIIELSLKCFLRDTGGSPKLARYRHLDRSGSRTQREILLILPARGASHIIRTDITVFR